MKSIVIAGTHSGVGKTSLTLGLLRVLKRRGVAVKPYKVGPDYIDPGLHGIAAGHPSSNLDPILMGQEGMQQVFTSGLGQVGVVEGVMGLYDGLDVGLDNGSTGHVARLLGLPVILVVDVNGMSASALAHIKGYLLHDPAVNIAGIILNKMGKGYHDHLKDMITKQLGIPVLGHLALPKEALLASRHLGLIQAHELSNQIDLIADEVEKTIDVDRLLSLMKDHPSGVSLPGADRLKGMRWGIAMDEAFSFYYHDSLTFLEKSGVTLVPFSPLHDEELPQVDFLYFGGGYPELHKKTLTENIKMRKAILEALSRGLPAYAECGGMMYLGQSLDQAAMVGFLPMTSSMTEGLQPFGYVRVNNQYIGHSFHYSKAMYQAEAVLSYQVEKLSNKKQTWSCGIRKKRVLGSYVHLHLLNNIDLIYKILDNGDI